MGKILKGYGHRISAVSITMLMLGMMFIGLMSFSEDVAAQSPLYADATRTGYIDRDGPTYPPAGPGSVITGTLLSVGQDKSANYYSYRTFLSFDTSYIPDNAVIQEVMLYMRLYNDYSAVDFSAQVYQSEYGTLDTGDWDDYHTYQGDLLYTTAASNGRWYSMNLMGSSISTTGYSEYLIKSSLDNTSAPVSYQLITFYGAGSAYAPYLLISYVVYGTTFSMHLTTSDIYYNGTLFASIEDWNLTYERWAFEFDTAPTESCNVSISIMNESWEFIGIQPNTGYTLSDTHLNITDAWMNTRYNVWFAVPKINPYSTVHLSLYNEFTGEGFFWESMKVMICLGSSWDNITSETVPRPDYDVESGRNYTVRVFDYFDNPLVDYSFVANAQDVFVTIAVPYYSWQIFNMNELPVLVKIYWNNSGSPWEFFVGPQWIIERNLKGGNYTFMVTFYEADGTAGTTVSYVRTVPNAGLNASFIYVSGTNLSEIISDIEGVMAVQQIITSLISPSTVLIYENLPLAPVQIRSLSLQDSIVIDPYLILEATTYQNATVTRYIDTTLEQTHPSVVAATYYVLSDILSFSGTYASEIYINDTGGTNLYHSTVLPATYHLDGQEVTIWSNTNLSVSRASTWREITEYAINYYPTQHKWETTVSLNNTYTLDYYTPYWYVAFPEDAVVNQETVTLYDLDNSVYLSQRTNFDVTAGGVHVTLTQLNTSSTRSFVLTFWDYNSTIGIGAPNLIAEAYTSSTLNGVPMKYTAVQWFNIYSVEYRGEVYITLNFTYGDYLLRSSIVLIDETSGNIIPSSQYIYTERTIIILTDGVGTVAVGGARNYGIYFTLDYQSASDDKEDFFFGPIVVNGKQFYIGTYAISYFYLLLIAMWGITVYVWFKSKKNAQTMLIMSGAVTVIGVYLSRFM